MNALSKCKLCGVKFKRKIRYVCNKCLSKRVMRYRVKSKYNKYAVEFRQKVKKETLLAYGNKCKCCGETNPHFLTIDHVYNDGYKEKSRGTILYAKLRKQNYPKDRYQLLCMNCNFGKQRLGYCPHILKGLK